MDMLNVGMSIYGLRAIKSKVMFCKVRRRLRNCQPKLQFTFCNRINVQCYALVVFQCVSDGDGPCFVAALLRENAVKKLKDMIQPNDTHDGGFWHSTFGSRAITNHIHCMFEQLMLKCVHEGCFQVIKLYIVSLVHPLVN